MLRISAGNPQGIFQQTLCHLWVLRTLKFQVPDARLSIRQRLAANWETCSLHYSGSNCIADIGRNVFSCNDDGSNPEFVAFAIDEDLIIGFRLDNGHWLLNLNVFDKNDDLIMLIVDNELVYSISPWDIELVGRNLTIREAQRRILVDILFGCHVESCVKRR